ncbi:unnamed protein product [Bemisia tabaci]|uniref:Uncharacterized protein n=1 Tax=Bemisia tabaci TaxID=7038 RepID=A0A9P0AJX8_BEMTA|nr:unnamed protein product [Bemisia tabaci]
MHLRSNIEKTIKRAMHWREYYVFYDSDGCWGYHWVMYWATGTPPKPRIKNSLIAGFDTPMHENCRLNTITKRPYPDPKRAHRRDMKLHMKKTKLSWRNYLYEWYWVDGQSISP